MCVWGGGVYTQLHNFKRAFFKFLFLHLKNYIKKYVITPFAYFVQKENRRMHQISWSCSTGSSEHLMRALGIKLGSL